jgi:hypothetical protein
MVTASIGNSLTKEINTVFYDPKKITIEDMVKALKAVGTYGGLAE